MVTPTELLIFLLILAVCAGFWFNLKARETALRAGKQLCAEVGYQFLDDSVAMTSVRFWRDAAGRLVLQREYSFAYSVDGTDRYEGEVMLHGSHVAMSRMR
jgi:3-oxoacyl-[acyl-carrier-protein] synthase III